MGSVTVNAPKTPVTKGSNGIAAATVPNVCKMPGPPAPFVPTPLPNIGKSSDTPKGYSTKVKIEGNSVAIRGATFNSQGDIASKGTGGGLISANTHGPTKFVGPGSLTVQIEGKNVQLLGDPMLNNCGPSGSPPNAATMAGVVQAPGMDAGVEEVQVDPGNIELKVVDVCNGDAIADARVTVEKTKVYSDKSGVANISDLTPLTYEVEVWKKFLDGKYSTFLVHYPRVMWESKAESKTTVTAEVLSGQTAKIEAQLVVYRLIDNVVFHRKHLDLNPDAADKYGHWWTVMGDESYGWWPKYRIGDEANYTKGPPDPPKPPTDDAGTLANIAYMFADAIHSARQAAYEMRNSQLGQTFFGVEGELNGVTSFLGKPNKDPHALAGDIGHEVYSPILDDCRSDADVMQAMREFTQGYSGGWSWFFELGNHCHSFQKSMMTAASLDKFKVIK